MGTSKFKISFPYWDAIEVKIETQFDTTKKKYFGKIEEWNAPIRYGWQEYTEYNTTIDCELKTFEIVEINRAYGDNGTDFFIEGICIEIDLMEE